LAKLRRNSRKRPDKKAGRNRPRPCNSEDDEIVAASAGRQTKLGESNLSSSTRDKSPTFSRSKLNKTNNSLNVSAISSISTNNSNLDRSCLCQNPRLFTDRLSDIVEVSDPEINITVVPDISEQK